MYRFDLRESGKNWKRMSPPQIPRPRHQHTFCHMTGTNKLYIFGGIVMPDNIFLNDVWEIEYIDSKDNPNYSNCTSRKIETTGKAPKGRKGHSAVYYGEKMFIIGGQGADNDDMTNSTPFLLINILNLSKFFIKKKILFGSWQKLLLLIRVLNSLHLLLKMIKLL